jgi:hypothetical protein
MFDRIVCISLSRRPERRRAVSEQLANGEWPFGPVDIFPAVDGAALPVPPGWTVGAGAWGCLQSHRGVIQTAILDRVQHVLVLEDDFVLRRDFARKMQKFLQSVPADFDGLMLGGQHHATAEPVGDGIVRCINTQRTHAYSARRAWQEELYRMWCAPRMATHCDWVMGPACRRFRIYAPDPFLIGQASSYSDISCRQQTAKFWQPPTGDELVILLRAERPLVEELRKHGWHTGYHRDAETDYDVGLCEVVNNRKKLTQWVWDLQWEVVSEEDWVLCVWHPRISAVELRAAWPGPVIEVEAADVAAALGELERWRNRQADKSVSA